MLNGIIVGVSVVLLMLAAEWVSSKQLRMVDYVFAGIYGLLAGMIVSLAPLLAGPAYILAPFALIVTVLMMGYLVYWWSSPKALSPLGALMVIIFFVANAAAVMTAAPSSSGFLKSLLLIVPEMVLISTIGTMLVNLLWVYQNGKFKILAISLGIVAGIIALLILIFRVNWADLPRGPVATETETETTGTSITTVRTINTNRGPIAFSGAIGFYNLALQADNVSENNFDFGFCPSLALTAEDYDLDLRTRAAQDPALAAAIMAWWDAITGTRFTGRFYETCKGQWADTINMARDEFIADPDVYYEALVPFYRMMDEAKVSTKMGYNLNDQMYMNPYTSSGIPDIIVMKTDQDGIFLVYTITIKGNTFEVPYRINCGYQPTNVQEVMHIIPDDSPRNYTPETNPPRREEQPETNPPRREEQPETNPQPETSAPKKDPGKSPTVNTQPNDDSGPGPATSNGDGATTSTADQPTNSTSYETPQEYAEVVEELADINANQATGADDNTPTTASPPSTTVDNNGDAGNGGAPINSPTTVSPPAEVADTGQAISDTPGEAWGGPPD